ncbi:hypothetical protein CEXT_87771 [Caerostris extrusa]|uniref:Uncharacterized protein n=1 Tax=Caerostris extrusa TaxID=172846 RepID=A0AAV4QWQ3_CAEEX|nr:hypothetical protein CEXT_87771 [Caerostris extrusa]
MVLLRYFQRQAEPNPSSELMIRSRPPFAGGLNTLRRVGGKWAFQSAVCAPGKRICRQPAGLALTNHRRKPLLIRQSPPPPTPLCLRPWSGERIGSVLKWHAFGRRWVLSFNLLQTTVHNRYIVNHKWLSTGFDLA